MTDEPAAAGEPARIQCPRCGGSIDADEGAALCSLQGHEITLLRFQPVVDLVPEVAAAGRCARHPNKDATAACGRCGSYVCEVCVTRTGEQLLCPACFDLLHGRGELDTTRTTRFRWDDLALWLGVLSLIPCGLSLVTVPANVAILAWTIRRRRREPWLSVGRVVVGIVFALVVPAAFIAVAVAK